jgi:MFS family permease
MVGAVLGGIAADRFRRRLPGGRILTQSLGLILGAPFIYACGMTREIGYLIPAMTAFGFCKGLYDANIWASLFDVVPPARRASAVGLMNMIGWFGGGFGSLMIGVVVQRGMSMSTAIASTAVIYAFMALVLLASGLLLAPRDVRRSQAQSSGETAYEGH